MPTTTSASYSTLQAQQVPTEAVTAQKRTYNTTEVGRGMDKEKEKKKDASKYN
jgi:hypothetical protein